MVGTASFWAGNGKTGGKNRLFMSPESAWQGNLERRWRACHGGRELARQGRTGQETCKPPTAEPPLYRQNSEPTGIMARVILEFFCQMVKSLSEQQC